MRKVSRTGRIIILVILIRMTSELTGIRSSLNEAQQTDCGDGWLGLRVRVSSIEGAGWVPVFASYLSLSISLVFEVTLVTLKLK